MPARLRSRGADRCARTSGDEVRRFQDHANPATIAFVKALIYGLDSLRQDLRYTLRSLRRDAGLTTFIILIAGFGIGASSTVFSVVNTLLLRPLPFADADRLVWIATETPSGMSGQTTQVGHVLDLRERARNAVGAGRLLRILWCRGQPAERRRGEPERLSGVPVTANFFDVLGVRPVLGRGFTAEEAVWNGPKVVFWGTACGSAASRPTRRSSASRSR